MTSAMITTNDDSQTELVESLDVQKASFESEQAVNFNWFSSLSRHEKRFHILFYALAGLTGILVVQLIWQIAVLTVQ